MCPPLAKALIILRMAANWPRMTVSILATTRWQISLADSIFFISIKVSARQHNALRLTGLC
jgi:hypothetical protein